MLLVCGCSVLENDVGVDVDADVFADVGVGVDDVDDVDEGG